jgi:hypothetical protein
MDDRNDFVEPYRPQNPVPAAAVPKHIADAAIDPYHPLAVSRAWSDARVVLLPDRIGPKPTTLMAFGAGLGVVGTVGTILAVASVITIGAAPFEVVIWCLLIAALGVLGFLTGLHRRNSYLEIGPEGLAVQFAKRHVGILWEEISRIAVAVAPQNAYGTRSSWAVGPVRIIMAPTRPKFGNRELRPLISNTSSVDGAIPASYTHYLLVPTRVRSPEDTAPVVEVLETALRRFAGDRFTGTIEGGQFFPQRSADPDRGETTKT